MNLATIDLIPSDDEVAQRIRDCEGDPEGGHIRADSILCEVLERIGFTKTVEEFLKLQKWYA